MQRSEGFLGSRIKLSNSPTVLTVAIINISELFPRAMGMVMSTSCLWQGAHATGERQTGRAESRAQNFYVCTSSQPHNISKREGVKAPELTSRFGAGCAELQSGSRAVIRGRKRAKFQACCLWIPKPLLQNVDVALRAASS